ncbi:MAG TPA: hypothetical protein VM681_08795 [Candidatus Thermoplasmatota archaeon]|nr:hypothetical protein [Candidatus Thermoplasmatota archaeon]
MASALELLNLVFAVGTVAIALALLAFNRTLPSVLLFVFLLGWGLSGLAEAAASFAGLSLVTMWALVIAVHFWILAAMIAFAVVYPNLVLTRARKASLAALALIAFAGFFLSAPIAEAIVTGGGALTPAGKTFLFGITASGYPVAVLLLGRRWLASPPGDYRTQVAWGLLPIAFWNLHDGLGFVLYPTFLGARHGPSWIFSDPLVAALGVAVLASVLFTGLVWATALARFLRGSRASDDRALALVLLYALPITFVQVLQPGYGHFADVPKYHLIVDYLVVPLIVYGVLRHRVVDIDLKVKWSIRQSTVAASFLAVFFVVSTVAQEFLADQFGWLMGGLAAGALLFALAPLLRFADRFSSAAVPHVKNEADYLTYRRYQIYKVALEGTLRDGVLSPAETAALSNLRTELGLTMEDHVALEGEMSRRAAVMAA